MRLVDVHSHTNFSIDSKNTMVASCISAMNKGLRGISFTEHVDSNPKEWGHGLYDSNAYFKELDRVRRLYGDQIELLAGIEFSESHIYGKELEAMSNLPYDVVLGSVHWIDAGYIGDKDILAILSQEEVEERYFDAIRNVIAFGKIDVLAHFDITKRSFGTRLIEPDKVTQMLIELVESSIALEINTSSLRKGLKETMPEIALVEEFVRLGGKRITLGSDAHYSDDLGADFVEVLTALSDDARRCVGYFSKRRFISLWEMEKQDLVNQLDNYQRRLKEYSKSDLKEIDMSEQATIELFRTFVQGDYSKLTPEQSRGHITGSAWIVNASKTKVLMTHHKKLDIWVQLGGHVDLNESVLQGATREAFEESGLKSIQLKDEMIFDLDAHRIPKNKEREEHTHFDVRFCFVADDAEELVITPESKDLKWVSFEDIEDYTNEESIRRMVRKTIGLEKNNRF